MKKFHWKAKQKWNQQLKKQTILYHINILLLKLILEGARTKHDMFEAGPALNKGAEMVTSRGPFQPKLFHNSKNHIYG